MNIYRQSFRALCPENGRQVDYQLTIETDAMILVERLRELVKNAAGYHEDIANELHDTLGGRQTIIANHHGTIVETIRP